MLTVIVSPVIPEVNAEPPQPDYKPVIEYFEARYNLVIRATVIGHIICKDSVNLIVQPFASAIDGVWCDMQPDGTTLSICASKMIAQVS